MKIKKIKVYEYIELSKEAQEKAYQDWRADVEHDFLNENLIGKLDDLLKKYKITSDNAEVMYSLSYCQDDGVMFYGDFEWKKYTIKIKQSGRYYHSNSKDIMILNEDDEAVDDYGNQFENIYQEICHELEKYSYQCIEDEESLETFRYCCENYQYTFLESGKMENI